MNLLTLDPNGVLSGNWPFSYSFSWRFQEVLRSSNRICHTDDNGYGGSGHGGSGHSCSGFMMVIVVVLIQLDRW